ncbi:uncharacterized protein RAG0_03614 [Rhynchosporium agropyri]|uniref:Uncharacterized protein n=1 Tax=Rhynchosporium agropyri TaxID=914238 RepID=A0A1E1K5G5_9HELO|nr:uncharacterized protein RAG0_03614 [Rhynchosporium agropyri]
MDSTRRQSRQSQVMYSSANRALCISRTKTKPQPDVNLDFTHKMARAKAAMLAMEQQCRPSNPSVPEIVITPSLVPIIESDDEK